MVSTRQRRLAGKGFNHGRVEFRKRVLTQILQSPKPLHAGLVGVVGTVGGFKSGDDAKEFCILGFEGGRQCCGCAMAHAGNQLPLVDQIRVAAQRRGTPSVAGDTDARMGQGLGTHAHFDARRQRRLAAVDSGYTQTG